MIAWVFEPKFICRRPFYLQSRKVQTLQKKSYPTRSTPRVASEVDGSDTRVLDDLIRQRHGKGIEMYLAIL